MENSARSLNNAQSNLDAMTTRINDAFAAGTLDSGQKKALFARVENAANAIITKRESLFTMQLDNLDTTLSDIYAVSTTATTQLADVQTSIDAYVSEIDAAKAEGLITEDAYNRLKTRTDQMVTNLGHKDTLATVHQHIAAAKTAIEAIDDNMDPTEGIAAVEPFLQQINGYEEQINTMKTNNIITEDQATRALNKINDAKRAVYSKGGSFASREISEMASEGANAMYRGEWETADSHLDAASDRLRTLYHHKEMMTEQQRESISTMITRHRTNLKNEISLSIRSQLNDINATFQSTDYRKTSADNVAILSSAMTDLKATQQMLNDLYFIAAVDSDKRTEFQTEIDAQKTAIETAGATIFDTTTEVNRTRIVNINDNTTVTDLVAIGQALDRELTELEDAYLGGAITSQTQWQHWQEIVNLKRTLSFETNQQLGELERAMRSEVANDTRQATTGSSHFSSQNARSVNQYLIDASHSVGVFEAEVEKAFSEGLILESDKRQLLGTARVKQNDVERAAVDSITREIEASVSAGQSHAAHHQFFFGLIDSLFANNAIEESTKNHLINILDRKMPQN